MVLQVTPEQIDWLKGFLASGAGGMRPEMAVNTAGAPLPEDAGLPPAPAPNHDPAASPGGAPAMTSEEAHQREIDAAIDSRRAQRDAEVDEYGIEKPPVSWTEKLTDIVAPAEVINDKDTAWYETIGRTLAVVPAAVLGHTMDEIAPINTRLGFKIPVPVLGEMAEGEERARYLREREEHEERLKREAAAKDGGGDEPASGTPGPAQDGTQPQGQDRPGPWAEDAGEPE